MAGTLWRRSHRSTAVVALALTTLGCSLENPADDEGLSWECLRVRTIVDLTISMSVGQARGLLQDLTVDPQLSADEAVYARDLLGALDGVDDSEQLGDRLDGVPCTLGAEPT
jgi:hypothetical protein